MLSRPSKNESSCFDMLAAKACSPARDSLLLRHGRHAFGASRATVSNPFAEGRESMAPPLHSQNCTIGNATLLFSLGPLKDSR